MSRSFGMAKLVHPIAGAWLSGALLLVPGCGESPLRPESPIALEPFKEMARAAMCAESRNRLFLIDRQLVFWDRRGDCIDALFSETLYGSTPSDVLCRFKDSIGGPVKSCTDPAHARMFDTILGHLDDPDLGLSPSRVEPVPF